MASTAAAPSGAETPAPRLWYSLDAAEVASALGVSSDAGLSADEAAARLKRDGP